LSGVTLSLVGLGTSFYLTRVASGGVTSTSDTCEEQQALVWSGATDYCYDCVQIKDCGFCAGQCMSDAAECPDGTEFVTSSCTNPYAAMSCAMMILYLFMFGLGMGGMPWTVNSEIYPLQYRAYCSSLSTASNWVGNIVISASFLTISSPGALTAYGAFWLYAGVCVVGWVWLFGCLPETKGLGLEEIEKLFAREGDGVLDAFDALDDETKSNILKSAA